MVGVGRQSKGPTEKAGEDLVDPEPHFDGMGFKAQKTGREPKDLGLPGRGSSTGKLRW